MAEKAVFRGFQPLVPKHGLDASLRLFLPGFLIIKHGFFQHLTMGFA